MANLDLLEMLINKCPGHLLFTPNKDGKDFSNILKEKINHERYTEFMGRVLPYDKPPARYGM